MHQFMCRKQAYVAAADLSVVVKITTIISAFFLRANYEL
jgi:hypothetical protein